MTTITVDAEVDLTDLDPDDLLLALRSMRVIDQREFKELQARARLTPDQRKRDPLQLTIRQDDMEIAREWALRGNRTETCQYLARALGHPFDRALS
ncbi:hypothetical protein [Pannonibacter sp. SL95]|uniref:hypothetical protein n=1 Tax=Pannonibacter sp. SL95 TaxID=2995153 RepID=UPI002275EE82|nr:hypothetical protein [Pannonibacter sp. SL95]MCY1704514.1 hypothetical protein [Pannonibacter sp. SL95]MCY1707299.1 hypothetical protein [Pannonibacter sp. SL95]MCY1709024.1 hypothetical protein [Pannonibacter sp. SL95]